MEEKPPKVFISYSHDSDEHKKSVLEFSDRLRQDGIDCHIDQYEQSPSKGWPRWMEYQIERADFILVICTETYKLRFKGDVPLGEGKGVKWEGAVINHTLYNEETLNNKFIPVLFSASHKKHIPLILSGASFYDVSTETDYEKLYRHLTNQPAALKPTLGKSKSMPPLNVQQPEQFSQHTPPPDRKVVRLFLSAPDDVEKDKERVKAVVKQINNLFGETHNVRVEAIDWTGYAARYKGQSQEVINEHIKDHDIFLGILWKLFDLEEKFTLACENVKHFGKPHMLVYFSQQPFMPPKEQTEILQWSKMLVFKTELQQQGLAHEYEGLEQFSEMLSEHLSEVLQKWFKPQPGTRPRAVSTFTPYLKSLRQETMYIDIRGLIITGKGKIHQFPIEELYIPLKTHYYSSEERSPFKEAAHEEVVLQKALKEQKLFIKGDPGSGKTTFLRLITYILCQKQLGVEVESPFSFSGMPLPLFIRLGRLSRYIRQCEERPGSCCPFHCDSPEWLLHYLEAESLAFNWKLSAEDFHRELEEGRCIILLDGLDEAPNHQVRVHLSRLASNLVNAYEKCQIVMTSRPTALTTGDVVPIDFHTVEIASLDKEATEDFLSRWCSILYADAPDKSHQYMKELKEALTSHQEIRRMAKTPVMLTALAVVHWNENRLPEQRAELYESVLTWLFRSREDKEDRLKADRCRKLLQKLALAMLTHHEGRQREVGIKWAAQTLESEFKGDDQHNALEKAENFLHTEMVDSGVIVERSLRVEYWHLSFQEYLAAFEIGGLAEQKQAELLFEKNFLYQSEWREVILLLGGVLYKQGEDKINSFINKMIENAPEQVNNKTLSKIAREAALLGGIVRDLSPFDYKPSHPRFKEIIQKVMGIFDKDTFRTIPVQIRIEAADALGSVGDPRFDRESDLWVHIPAGTFWMGAQSDDPNGRNYDEEADFYFAKYKLNIKESPPHEVELSGYWIGKYPVTVYQYRRFIEDGGYKEKRYWEAGGFNEFTEPKDWEKQVFYPTRPVVGVSWYEGKAYASWAGCSLPTEAQWEWAARGIGEEYRKYPWGNREPDKETMNYKESNIGHPTPVGIFPESCSPKGVIDMAGNVWEWCEDWLHDYSVSRKVNPVVSSMGSLRVFRGGGWGYSARFCRSALRNWFTPHDRSAYVGFRLRS